LSGGEPFCEALHALIRGEAEMGKKGGHREKTTNLKKMQYTISRKRTTEILVTKAKRSGRKQFSGFQSPFERKRNMGGGKSAISIEAMAQV